MSNDNKNDQFTDPEDRFFESDYDEETVDYDLDSDKFLEEELTTEAATSWGDEFSISDPEPEPEYKPHIEPDADDDQWYDDDEGADPAYDEQMNAWPLGLIAVAIIALLLLAAGGYGVLQQRTQMEEEIRQLRATLATTTSNTELAASRQAQRSLSGHNAELQARVKSLETQNSALQKELLSLAAPTPPPELEPEPVPVAAAAPAKQPSPEAKPRADKEKAPAIQSGWFVNFSSYKQEETANKWASKLKVDEGRVVVLAGTGGSSKYYRVRIIDLPNKEIAGKIAIELENKYKLPRLWVGKQ